MTMGHMTEPNNGTHDRQNGTIGHITIRAGGTMGHMTDIAGQSDT